jgi:hypothetical protein
MKTSLLTALVAAMALAQLSGGSNPECLGSVCTRPPIPRTGSFPASWLAGYANEAQVVGSIDDADGDGQADSDDNCPFSSNRDQLDGDGDGVGNACDNCAGLSNFSQLDGDGDAQGDACDPDRDGDGTANLGDNCPSLPNRAVNGMQADLEGDGRGDVCDTDIDGDGFDNLSDLCPYLASPNNIDLGNASGCRRDSDSDGIQDQLDNCPAVVSSNANDLDRDGLGDVCDLDVDGDGLNDKLPSLQATGSDNCTTGPNRNQRDGDFDGLGDVCDAKFCLVVDPSNVTDCLDPTGPLRVHGGGSISIAINQSFRLPLFANRNGVAIEYSWRVVTKPPASQLTIRSPTGWVNASRDFSYVYPFGEVPTVTLDVRGRYVLELQGRLVFPDEQYPTQVRSVNQLVIDGT